MENSGLITYRDATLLIAADSIASERQYVVSVVCHKLAHQWFGDIVTMVYDYEYELQYMYSSITYFCFNYNYCDMYEAFS